MVKERGEILLQNYQNINKARRYKAYVSMFGTTQFHLRHPLIIAWWSAALPGFGHMLLSKYLRGFILFTWEIVINTQANINLAMVHSFCGQFELAKEVVDPRWMLLYIPTYLYGIWDSYRTTVDLNRVYILAERENADFIHFQITPMEINYLDKQTPWVSVMWSAFMPGMGQLYIHRIIVAFFLLTWWIIIIYFSHFFEGIYFLYLGKIDQANEIVSREWLLFIPSVYFFSIYDAYVNTVENNKLFNSEQKNFLKRRYQGKSFQLPMDLKKRNG